MENLKRALCAHSHFIAIFFATQLALCSMSLAWAQTPYGVLVNGENEKRLLIATEENEDLTTNGLTATFKGDFTHDGLDVAKMVVTWGSSWFTSDADDAGVAWHVNHDSSEAQLEVWRLDESNATGSGLFLHLAHPGGIGTLILDDILKDEMRIPITLKVNTNGCPNWRIYPNPADATATMTNDQCGSHARFALVDVFGTTLLDAIEPKMELQHLRSGTYFILIFGPDRSVKQVIPFFVQH